MKPLMLAGNGVRIAGQAERFRECIESWKAPVVTTQLAKDLLPYDHPLFIGHPGVRGNRAANFAVQEADTIVVLGSSLHEQTVGYDRSLFAPRARILDVPDVAEYLKIEHGFVGVDPLWLPQCHSWKGDYHPMKEPHDLSKGPVNLYELADKLSDILPPETTIVVDSSSSWYAMGQAYRLKEGQRYLSSGALGALGWGMPACTGAAFGAPGRLIVGVIGDGSFQTNVHELAVWAHHQLSIKLFVVNNEGYACIRKTQERYCSEMSGVDSQSGLALADIEDIARSYRARFKVCPSREFLEGSIRDAISAPGPVVCEVIGQKNQAIMPSVETVRMPDGSMRSSALHEMKP